MKRNKKNFMVLLAIMLLAMNITGFAADSSQEEGMVQPRAGCSNYVLTQTGTARCTVKLCPGGFKRLERQDTYRQTCVRDNGTTYYNYDYRTVYISCSCL
ncbi:MAG: hypothetical protein RR444_03845 [Oscillospiraceae bacterium]